MIAAVWEAGYDPTLVAGQLAIDPPEPLDGMDNDGNGVIDDWNGPTYDHQLMPSPAPRHPPSPELASRLGLQFALEKGQLDLRYGVDTAGNTDESDESAGATPQTLVYPNLISIGATGSAGNAAAFSTYGEGVRLYALGDGNAVVAPGGQVMRTLGTSFAAPTVARAAAAMLAVNPDLTPAEVIEGLTSTARGEGAIDLPLLDAGAAVRWARARR